MNALDALLNRVSVTRLLAPAPTQAQRQVMFQAALRAPDHAQLRPWRFLCIEEQARERLGELYAQALQTEQPEATGEQLDKVRAMPLRAPLLVVVIASPKEHPKVPRIEQLLSAGCAAHGLLLAAHAQGVGAVWRTGEMAYSPVVAKGLGLAAGEEILGFIYLGTPEGKLRTAPLLEQSDFVSDWPA